MEDMKQRLERLLEQLRALLSRLSASLRQHLVDDWRDARRWWSVRLNAVGTVLYPLLISVQAMPPEIQALFPVKYRAIAAGLFALASLVARFVNQKKPA